MHVGGRSRGFTRGKGRASPLEVSTPLVPPSRTYLRINEGSGFLNRKRIRQGIGAIVKHDAWRTRDRFTIDLGGDDVGDYHIYEEEERQCSDVVDVARVGHHDEDQRHLGCNEKAERDLDDWASAVLTHSRNVVGISLEILRTVAREASNEDGDDECGVDDGCTN